MNNLNHKGQALAIFVIFIPVIIMVGTLVVDIGLAKYNSNRLDEITKEVLHYGLEHIDDEPKALMVDLLYQNDNSIDNYEIDIDVNSRKIKIITSKQTKGFFGSIVGKNMYKQKSSYVGYFIDEKIIIERDD